MTVWLESVGLCAPGLNGWDQARPVLMGAEAYRRQALPPPRATLLAANERRRTTGAIRLALQAAEDAMRGTKISAAEVGSVFASACGDLEIVDKICTALCLPDRPVSPTQFHNSVHNAPAGYWSLGAAARMPSTSIAGREHTFVAGLLEAWTMVEAECAPVLLVAYDWPPPPVLFDHCPVTQPFAVALLLNSQPSPDAITALELKPDAGQPSTLPDPELEALRRDSPAARSLPLLAAVAAGGETAVQLPYSTAKVVTVQCRNL